MTRAAWVYFGLIVALSLGVLFPEIQVPMLRPSVLLFLLGHYIAILVIFWLVYRFKVQQALIFGTILALVVGTWRAVEYPTETSLSARMGIPLAYDATHAFLFNLPFFTALFALVIGGWRLVLWMLRRLARRA